MNELIDILTCRPLLTIDRHDNAIQYITRRNDNSGYYIWLDTSTVKG